MSTAIPIQIDHRPGALVVTATLPSVDVQDLRLALTRDRLTIEARFPSGWRRADVPFASPVDDRRATMHHAGGVLSLFLPTLAIASSPRETRTGHA
jgi:HSP20 family molecular chaperone IbpA